MRLIRLIILPVLCTIIAFTTTAAEPPPPPLPIINDNKNIENTHDPKKIEGTKSNSFLQKIKSIFGSKDNQDKSIINKSKQNNNTKSKSNASDQDSFIDLGNNKLPKLDKKLSEQEPLLITTPNAIKQNQPASKPLDSNNHSNSRPEPNLDPDISKLLKEMSPVDQDQPKNPDKTLPEANSKNSPEKVDLKGDKPLPISPSPRKNIPAEEAKLPTPVTAPTLPIPELPNKPPTAEATQNPALPALQPTAVPTQQPLPTPPAPQPVAVPTQQPLPVPTPKASATTTVTPAMPQVVIPKPQPATAPVLAPKSAIPAPIVAPKESKIIIPTSPLPVDNQQPPSTLAPKVNAIDSSHKKDDFKNTHSKKTVHIKEVSPEETRFITDEAKVLLLPNDDLVLGQLSQQAKIEQMDMHSYIKLFKQSLDKANRAQQEAMVENFIINYDFDSISNDKKDASDQEVAEAFEAIRKDNLSSLRSLLDHYHLLQVIDQNGYTLLHESAKLDNYSLTKFLIMRGISLTSFDFDQDTPLMIAEKEQNNDIINLLRKANPYQ